MQKKSHKVVRDLTIAFLVVISMASFSSRKGTSVTGYEDEVLSQPTRREIYNLIREKEGCHFRLICRELDKKIGVIQYHLNVLEKNGYIRSVKDGRYKCFFAVRKAHDQVYLPQDNLSYEEKKVRENLITSMKRTTPKKIITYLSENGNEASHQTLAKISNVTPQAITFHCQRLLSINIIKSMKVGREKVYSLTDEIIRLMPYVKA